MKENTENTAVIEKWHKPFELHLILTVIGSLLLFTSWLLDKGMQSKWTDQRQKLGRSQLVIDIAEVNRSQYELYYNECMARKNCDSAQVGNIQAGLALIYLKLLAWSKGRVTDNPGAFTRLTDEKSRIKALNERYLAQKQYDSINILFNQTAQQFRDSYRTLDSQFTEKFQEVKHKEEFWGTIFKMAYILGSSCFGLAFMVNPKYPYLEKFYARKKRA